MTDQQTMPTTTHHDTQPQGMDMVMNMMPMYFGCPVDNIYLFKSFTSNSTGTFIAWLFAVVVLSGLV